MRALILILGLGLVNAAHGADKTFASGPQRTRLIELFTSEGCSSCPPAEAWLSKLKNDPGLWKNFVPLAFHVDYWDHLGWKDPFASKEWTKRQSDYSAQWGAVSVYTPGFVLDGKEWRGFSIPEQTADNPGLLKFSIAESGAITAEFQATEANHEDLEVHFAVLGDGASQVTAGENRGRKLNHDFVVISLISAVMKHGRAELKSPSSAKTGVAIAAWVTSPNQLLPLQAVGGWLK